MGPAILSLIEAPERGDRSAADALFSTLYSELHRIARRKLARHGSHVTLGATTLLHEAYLEMARKRGASFADHARFMAYTSRVMRGIIIDFARRKKAIKRGGQFHITSSGGDLELAADHTELSRIGEALEELGQDDPELAQVVDMKFFCGFTFAQIAAIKGISERTAQRQWEKARLYLHHKLSANLEV